MTPLMVSAAEPGRSSAMVADANTSGALRTRSQLRRDSAADRPVGWLHRVDVVMAGIVIVLSFLPYAAVSLGANSNIPFSSLACMYVVARRLTNRVVLWSTLALTLMPFAASFARMFVAPHPLGIGPYLVWFLSAIVTPGMIAALLILGRRALPVLSLSIALSSLYTIIQSFFLTRGTIPLMWYYAAKGYRSVEDWSQEIVTYHPRPFGLFPEPSFMAGTLALAALFMVMCCIWWDVPYSWREWAALILTIPALISSVSGSLALTLAVLVGAATIPLVKRSPLVVSFSPAIVGAGVVGSMQILGSRTSGGFNSSWVDRPSSIIIAFQPFLHDVWAFLFGIGNGMVNYYFLTATFPLYAGDHYNTLPDMFSVTGRILVENGAVFALPVLVWMCWQFVRYRGPVRRLVGAGALAAWLVVATLTITYYSAFWIFAMPGAMYALGPLSRSSADDVPQP